MNHYLTPKTELRSRNWQKISRQLSEFLARDFRSIHNEIMPELFPRSHDRRMSRDVPVLWNLAKELAVAYRRPPVRHFEGDTRTARILTSLYRALRIDATMGNLAEMLCVQHTILGAWVPIPNTQKWTVRLFNPWELEIDADPIVPTSLSSVSEIRARVAIKATHDQVTFGVMRLNAETCTYEGGGKTTGVYTEDGSNPFGGKLPVFIARLGNPLPGDWASPLPLDLWSAQVNISVCMSGIDHVVRNNSHGIKTLTGTTAERAQAMEFGPDVLLGLADDQTLEIKSPTTNITHYLASTNRFIDYLRLAYGLRPESFTGSAVTALAKRLELVERDAFQQDMARALTEAEQSLARAATIALSWNFGAQTQPLETPIVSIEFAKMQLPVDELHHAQAQRMEYVDGVSSPIQTIAANKGISVEQAEQVLLSNVEEYKRVRALADDTGMGEAPADGEATTTDEGDEDAQIFKYHIDSGVVTVNEVRAALGLGPVAGGGKLMQRATPGTEGAGSG